MYLTNKHLKWLQDEGEEFTTTCGKVVPVYTFTPDALDVEAMKEWAKHFRNHYCSDDEIKYLKPPGMSNSDYLTAQKFPDLKAPGPSIKAGDFSEILVADYLHFLNDYYVPRTRYDTKTIGNESTKGSDILAFKSKPDNPLPNDEMLIYEVKAKLSESSPDNRLQDAINDSVKDEVRMAESLNAIKQRLFDKKDSDGVQLMNRFQDSVDNPYKRRFGAAAVVSSSAFCPKIMSESDTSKHPNSETLELIVIHGKALMDVAKLLYERAANEA